MRLLCLICAFVFLGGCKAIEEARDNAAYKRVIGSDKLSEKAYDRLALSHPCVTDTFESPVYIKGKTDTMEIDSAIIFPVTNKVIHDSIKVITIHTHANDTIKIQLPPDRRAFNDLKSTYDILQGSQMEVIKQLALEKKLSLRKTWIMIGEGLLCLFFLIIYIKKK